MAESENPSSSPSPSLDWENWQKTAARRNARRVKYKAAKIEAAETCTSSLDSSLDGTSSLDSDCTGSSTSSDSLLDPLAAFEWDDDDDESDDDDDNDDLTDEEVCALYETFDWPMTGKLAQAQPEAPHSTEEFPVYTDPGLDLANYGLYFSPDSRIIAREGKWDLPPMIQASEGVWRADKRGRKAWALGTRLSPMYSNEIFVTRMEEGLGEVLGEECLKVQVVRLGWEESIVCAKGKKASVVVTVTEGTSKKGAREMVRTCWDLIKMQQLREEIGCVEVMEGGWGMVDVLPFVEQEVESGGKLVVDNEKLVRKRIEWFQARADRYRKWERQNRGIAEEEESYEEEESEEESEEDSEEDSEEESEEEENYEEDEFVTVFQ